MNKQRSLFVEPSVLRLLLIVLLASSQVAAVMVATQRAFDPSSESTILETYGKLRPHRYTDLLAT